MAESTLSLTFTDLKAAVGLLIGYGPEARPWSATELANVDACVQTGYRRAVHPPPLPGKEKSHEWSFLRPIDTQAVTSGDAEYDLPDDFGGILGPFVYGTTGDSKIEIPVVGEGQILRLRQNDQSTGRPRLAAIRPKAGFAGTGGSRWEVIFYPTPDASYTFTYRKELIVGKLSGTNLYPIGGMAFGELVKASCLLAAAEAWRRDRIPECQDTFYRELRAAISRDWQRAPEFLGANYDAGLYDRNRRNFTEGTFTHNGQETS